MIKTEIAYKSRNLQAFVREIQRNNRNPKDARVLDLLSDEDTNPILLIGTSNVLYRSRVIKANEYCKINKEVGFYGYGKEDSFVAPPEATKDMRANYRYIPYLYCCTSPYLSLVEVGPRIGADVSIATIKPKSALRIFDLSMGLRSKSKRPYSVTKINLLHDLSELFSKPITSDDDTLDYVPTQYIAEYIKNLGYDSLGYRSSLHDSSAKGIPPINVVVFSFDKCEVIGSNYYQVTKSNYECEQVDSGVPNPIQIDDGIM